MAFMDIVRYVISLNIGCFFGGIVLIRLLWRVIKNPSNVLSVKERNIAPKCLTDPNLGTHHYVQLKNVKLHYVANGEEGKPLMLFVHGFPEFWYSWRYQLREFARDYRVVAVDQRGYNDSDKPPGVSNYQVKHMVEDLKQLISALGYKSCVLVGHDWGGAISWVFAGDHPNLVEKLIIMNCPHGAAFPKYIQKNRSQFWKSWYMYFFQLPWLPELYCRSSDFDFFQLAFTSKAMGVQSGIIKPEDIEAYKYAFSKPETLTSAINYYRAAFRYGSRRRPKVESKTKIIWGCKDGALERGLAEASKEYVNDVTITYIEEASHWVQMDQPQKVNQIMRDFLNQSKL
ncbi:hypothetical protein LOTGIDRAFT_181264 [Lottia gigantea]|uniref:AB hydrolase-1 domain-containing protein n=1 Tax=Lottia gigantea TaxID=225164 RepID=V4BCL3_LOTGI|nr:hypothetical protein LOTGIDRAFT_181264 [Lottia gigantea]ESP05421.1 hypothetical protein LOTGIDRAFT_181264 [Lottia gigantea]